MNIKTRHLISSEIWEKIFDRKKERQLARFVAFTPILRGYAIEQMDTYRAIFAKRVTQQIKTLW